MKSHTGGIPYSPGRGQWNGTGEALSFNKGIGKGPSRGSSKEKG